MRSYIQRCFSTLLDILQSASQVARALLPEKGGDPYRKGKRLLRLLLDREVS